MAFQKKKFQTSLQKWYQNYKRDLPWRKTKDPYKILVSEIMLQQTQVSTVIPYYNRWLQSFPNFETLAKANENTVLKAWQGLGYYRRAKMLRLTAQTVCRDHHSKLPADFNNLLKLPGIGRYTAGAIASIAFEQKKAVLDGNVIRIIARLFAISENTTLPSTQKKLWSVTENLLPEKNIGDFNQALMELGATICFPRGPKCTQCPVSFTCQAKKLSQQENFPIKTPALKITKQTQYAFAILDRKNKLLVQKQKKGSRWAGLWTLPHFDSFKNGLSQLSLQKKQTQKLQSNRHGFTRYQITLHSFKVLLSKTSVNPYTEYEWIPSKTIKQYAFPAVHQKIIDEVFKNGIK